MSASTPSKYAPRLLFTAGQSEVWLPLFLPIRGIVLCVGYGRIRMTFDEESSTYKNGRRTSGGDILSRAYVALDDIELCSSKLIDNLKYPFTRMYAHRSCDSNPANLRRVVAAIRKSDTGKQMCWDAVCLGRSEEEVRGLSTERTAAMVESGAKHYSLCKRLALEEFLSGKGAS